MSIIKKIEKVMTVFFTELFYGFYIGDDVIKLHRYAQNRRLLAQKALHKYLLQLSYLRPYCTECADSLRQSALSKTVQDFIDEYY